MKRATPAIPLFGDAYIADTRHLSLEEHGAYLNLLMIAWRTEDCSLPDDDARIARMLGISGKRWAKLKPVVMDFWLLEGGKWTQKRLTKERQFVSERATKNSEAANTRWSAKSRKTKGTSDADAGPTQCTSDAPLPPIKKPSVSTRARTLPENWSPEPFGEGTEAAAITADWPEGETQRQAERFADHHRAKGSKFSDWQAAWGTWVRKSAQFAGRSQQRQPDRPRDYLDYVIAERNAAGGHG